MGAGLKGWITGSAIGCLTFSLVGGVAQGLLLSGLSLGQRTLISVPVAVAGLVVGGLIGRWVALRSG